MGLTITGGSRAFGGSGGGGGTKSYVFDTKTEMDAWLVDNAASLKVGDNLYIRATNTPDYWWDGSQALPIEGEKVDLGNYYTKSEIDGMLGGLETQLAEI